jgi:hypothetical protein
VEDPYHGPERRTHDSHGIEPVVLTRKLAEAIDGIDLAGHRVGDRLPLTSREASMLIAEGWARPTPTEQRRCPSADCQDAFDDPDER